MRDGMMELVKIALLALAVAGVTGAFVALREDELECEEAVAHLEGCCDDFSPHQVECEYVSGCGEETWPDLSVEEANCIEALECDEVRARDLCTKVPILEPRGRRDGGVLPRSTVCP